MVINGEAIDIKAVADTEILDLIVESFGREVDMEAQDENHVVLRFQTTVQDAVSVGERFVDHMEILEPLDIRQLIRERLQAGLKKYD